MSVLEAAAGIRRIVDMRMADEVRVFAAKRGVDLSAFTLLPFGGAGAVHAAAVAEELGMRRILVPPRPGAFSALGLLCTDVVHDYIRSELVPARRARSDACGSDVRAARSEGARRACCRRARPSDASFARELDLRYAGQGYELRMPLDGLSRALDRDALARRAPRFDERHAQIHGHAAKERPVEVVSYRLRVRVAVPKYQPRDGSARRDRRARSSRRSKASATFISTAETPVRSHALRARPARRSAQRVAGPAIVEQFDATTVVPPGWSGARRPLAQPRSWSRA